MSNNMNRKTENQMIEEMQALRASMMESGKQAVGYWTRRILVERAAA